MPLGIRPTVDFAFKLLFGDPRNADLLIHLLNSVLQLRDPIVSVTILNPYNEKEFEDGKLSIVDIKARDSVGASYIIEMQTTIPPGLANRLIYYTSGLYYSQMREGGSYHELQPAISICFLSGTLFPSIADGHLSFSLCDPIHQVTLGDQLQLHLVELAKYDIRGEQLAEATPLQIWAFFFSNAHRFDAEQLRELLPNPVYRKATGILEMIAREPNLRLLYDDRAKEEKDQFSFVKDARAEGKAEGIAEGEARGKLIGRIQILQQLLAIAQTDDASLSGKDDDSLASLASDLQQRLQGRS